MSSFLQCAALLSTTSFRFSDTSFSSRKELSLCVVLSVSVPALSDELDPNHERWDLIQPPKDDFDDDVDSPVALWSEENAR